MLVDLLKVIVGRPRPKLLFASGAYEFSWIGLGADHWSFPSGHAASGGVAENVALPFGVEVALDAERGRLVALEAAVA